MIGPPGQDLPGFWLRDIGFRYMIIEADDLARACKRYLARTARRFPDTAAAMEAVHSGQWPVQAAEPAPAPDMGRSNGYAGSNTPVAPAGERVLRRG